MKSLKQKNHLEKLRLLRLGKLPWNKDKPHSIETREKISKSKKGKPNTKLKGLTAKTNLGIANRSGENHYRWIKDRTTIKKQDRRNDYAYVDWRRQVWERDKWKCKIDNNDCNGRIEAHHILGWTAYPELRYEINNGITLCHFHHPRKRSEENRLIPTFKELVSQMNQFAK